MKHGDFGCFYLSENLGDSVDSKWPAKKFDWEDYLYELPQTLPDSLHQQAGKQRCDVMSLCNLYAFFLFFFPYCRYLAFFWLNLSLAVDNSNILWWIPFSAVDGPIILYNDQNFCFHLGSTINEAKDQCINPEGFASFIGLLESIPLHETGSDNGSSDYSMPDSR